MQNKMIGLPQDIAKIKLAYGWNVRLFVDDNGDLDIEITNIFNKTVHEITQQDCFNGIEQPLFLKFTKYLSEREEYGYFASQVMEIDLEHFEGMLESETRPWKIKLIEEQIRTLRGE